MSRRIVLFTLLFIYLYIQYAEAGVSRQKPKNENKKYVDIYMFDKKAKMLFSGKGLIDSKGVVSTNCSTVLKWLKEVENKIIIKTNDGKTSQIGKILSCNIKKDNASFLLEPLSPEEKLFLTNEIITFYPDKTHSPEVEKRNVDLETDNIQDLFERGLNHQKLKDYNKAIAFYKKALLIKPDHAESHINLGNIYFIIGRYNEALESYNNALGYSSEDNIYSLLSKIGTTYLILENYEKAIDTYKQIISLRSDSPNARFSLGLIYFINGNKEEAFNEYVNLQKIDDQLAENLFDLLYR